MYTRMILKALAALAILAPSFAGGRASSRVSDASLTRDEKREARELAVRVVTRLKETGDAERVAAEFFVGDYAEHYRLFAIRHAAGVAVDARVVAEADAADLRRAYAALMNLWAQQDLASDYEYRLAWSAGADEAYEPLALRDTLPPDFFDERGVDPLVAVLKVFLFGREEDEDAEGVDERAAVAAARIQTVARLRAFTSSLEACVAQLRGGVGRLKLEAEARERATGRRANPEDEGEAVKNSIYRVESGVLERDEYGLPAGTQLVRVRAWPYVVLLVRRDGLLRVLGVGPDFDGD